MTIIAILGPDGSGKTTQVSMLSHRLRKKGLEVITVRPVFVLSGAFLRGKKLPPLASPRVARVSRKGIHRRTLGESARTSLLMMFGYPYALLSYVIMRFLGRRRTVICDRFFYQFFFDVYGDRSLGIARSFPRPDIAFVLVASPTLCLSRTRNPFDSSVGADYYARVSQMLDELSNGFGFVPIRADLDAESVNDRIVNEVLRMMNIDST